MRGLGFFRDGGDLDFGEAGFFQEAVEGAFLETEPDIGVEFARFFEGVLVEIEDEHLAAGAENAVGFVHGGLRMLGVVERLREDGEVHRAIGQRHLLDVAELVGEIGETVFLGELGADLDHLDGVVDAPDLAGAAGEELRDQAFAGAEVGDVDGGGEAQREVADGLPGAAGAVVFAEPAGDEVEILFLCAAAFLENTIEIGTLFADDGKLGHGFGGGLDQREGAGGKRRAERIERFFAVAAVVDEVDLTQQRELGGDARLAHAEDFLQLGDGQFFAQDEREQAQARGVGEGLEDVPGSVHASVSVDR